MTCLFVFFIPPFFRLIIKNPSSAEAESWNFTLCPADLWLLDDYCFVTPFWGRPTQSTSAYAVSSAGVQSFICTPLSPCCAYCIYFCRLFICGMYFFVTCSQWQSYVQKVSFIDLYCVRFLFFFPFGLLGWQINSIVKKRRFYKCIYVTNISLCFSASFLSVAGSLFLKKTFFLIQCLILLLTNSKEEGFVL